MKQLSLPVSIFLKFYLKRNGTKNGARKFENTFSAAKNVLILLPEDRTIIENIAPLIEHLSKSGKSVVLVFHSRIGNAVQNLRKYHIEEFYDTDFNFLGMPKLQLKNKLNGLNADLLIAPTRQNDLQFLALAAVIRAKLKCGIAGPYSDYVFQLQFSAGRGKQEVDFINFLQYTGTL